MSNTLRPDPRAASRAYFFKGQAIHALLLAAMASAAWAMAAPALGGGDWLGISDTTWFALCLGEAVLHQLFVWAGWRSQLGWNWLTKIFGRHDLTIWVPIFMLLLVLRPLLVGAVAMADRGSLMLPTPLATALGVALLVPALYTGWSIHRYFGLVRATGADHFREEYRTMGLVREGAFAWTSNAMYVLALLGLWSIGLLAQSHAALAAAIFQHGYIWAHYLGTEKPDMELIYE